MYVYEGGAKYHICVYAHIYTYTYLHTYIKDIDTLIKLFYGFRS